MNPISLLSFNHTTTMDLAAQRTAILQEGSTLVQEAQKIYNQALAQEAQEQKQEAEKEKTDQTIFKKTQAIYESAQEIHCQLRKLNNSLDKLVDKAKKLNISSCFFQEDIKKTIRIMNSLEMCSKKPQVLSPTPYCLKTIGITSPNIIPVNFERLEKEADRSLWNRVNDHSEKYCENLGRLLPKDIEFISGFIQGHTGHYPSLKDLMNAPFLTFTIEGKNFSLYAKHTCASDYKDNSNKNSWVETIQVGCSNDPFLNTSTGRGTSLINGISPEWHEKLLKELNKKVEELNKEVKLLLRERISSISSRNSIIWAQVTANSEAYYKNLGLLKNDFDLVNKYIQTDRGSFPSLKDHMEAGFFKLTVGNKRFSFYTHTTCGIAYGGNWKETIQVGCSNDDSLNASTGRGTGLINMIQISPKEHQDLLEGLEKAKKKLRERIDSIPSEQEKLRNQAIKDSKIYCKQLGLKPELLKHIEDIFRDAFLTVTMEDKEFSFYVRNVLKGDQLIKTIQVYCNDESLNISMREAANVIPSELHQSLLEELEKSKEILHKAVDSISFENVRLRAQVIANSEAYCKQLGLNPDFLTLIEGDAFLTLKLEDKEFSFHIKDISKERGRSIKVIQVFCNDESLNKSMGREILLEWHEKIMNALDEGVKESLNNMVLLKAMEKLIELEADMSHLK